MISCAVNNHILGDSGYRDQGFFKNIHDIKIVQAYSIFKSGKTWKDSYRKVGEMIRNGEKFSPLSLDIAVSSAIIRANTRLKLPDAMVLATAVQLHADFLVSNDVGFPDVYKNVRHVGSKEMSERPK